MSVAVIRKSEISEAKAPSSSVPAVDILPPESVVNVKYAGQLCKYYNNWERITDDPFVLQCLKWYRLPFPNEPQQFCPCQTIQFTKDKKDLINESVAC
jgi:hypothetical protein